MFWRDIDHASLSIRKEDYEKLIRGELRPSDDNEDDINLSEEKEESNLNVTNENISNKNEMVNESTKEDSHPVDVELSEHPSESESNDDSVSLLSYPDLDEGIELQTKYIFSESDREDSEKRLREILDKVGPLKFKDCEDVNTLQLGGMYI